MLYRSRVRRGESAGGRYGAWSRPPNAPQPAPGPPRHPAGRGLLEGLVVAVLVATAALWRGGTGRRATTDLGHVHGLRVDPDSNTRYVGTHESLFRLPADGAPVLVADRVQDFMGNQIYAAGKILVSHGKRTLDAWGQ